MLLEAVRQMQMQSQTLLRQIRGSGSLAPLAVSPRELTPLPTVSDDSLLESSRTESSAA